MGLNLANKYRPKRFLDVLGQGETIKILGSMLETRSYPPAILFMGNWGSGKTTLARIFSNAVLCRMRVGPEPCGECVLCREFWKNPDKVFNFREVDAASEGGVSNVRDIVEESHFRAIGDSDRKVLLIDECHMLSTAAQNAFLKLLEEGSENMLFVFCTTDPDKMLRTIFSRTLHFRIAEIPKSDIVERLSQVCKAERIEYEEPALPLIVSVKKAHVRDCFMLLEQLRHGPGITVESIRKILNLDLEAEYYRLLHMVTSDVGQLLVNLESLVQRVAVHDIYDGIGRAALTAFKYLQGVETGLPEADMVWCRKLAEKLGERSLRVARFLTSKPPSRSLVSLECDLFSLRHFLERGFPDEPRQALQGGSEVQFASKIEELQYYGAKRNSREDGAAQREISLMEALTLLNAYRIGDDE